MVEDTGFIVLPVDTNDTSKGVVMVLPILSSSCPELIVMALLMVTM